MFRKSLANSESMELGIEALVKSTVPPGVRHLFGKQGLTLADLLMKVRRSISWTSIAETNFAANPTDMQISAVPRGLAQVNTRCRLPDLARNRRPCSPKRD
jgi:hypothetical protein